MANLIDVANELEYVPKDQLASFVNDPNSRYPSYMVLSEIQRRTQLEKAYNAQQTEMQPNTTVADEVVANFTGQGLASAMPPTGMNPQEAGMQGMQMMAEGGITGYREGGQSYYNRALEGIKGRYTDEDGLDYSQIATDAGLAALSFSPIGIGARGALLAGKAGLAGIRGLYGKGAFKLGESALKRMSPKMRDKIATRYGSKGKLDKTLGSFSGNLPSLVGKNIIRRTGLVGGLGGLAYGDGPDDANKLEGNENDNQGDVGDILTSVSGDAVSGKSEASFDPLDMARMGFALMGARDTSELASGLSGITEDIQSRRRAQPLIDAQIKELQSKIESYEATGQYALADQLYKIASTLSAQYGALFDAGQDTSSVVEQLMEVNKRYSEELGIESPSEKDIIARNMAD